MITIIDYGAGNLFSVKKALEYFNADVQISDNGKIILKSDGIILPGVGAFGAGIKLLEKKNLKDSIAEAVRRRVPLLGV
ncbi:MAG TPA: imidazole glycerol phosphate synthase subunit HisH, partial [bacterium]|nr:imidazole glycerol phosphate synthase subunit HisH [bacterium]